MIFSTLNSNLFNKKSKSTKTSLQKLLMFAVCFTTSHLVFSQNPFVSTAPVQDGTVTAAEYGNCSAVGGAGGTWYMAWDNTNLYIAKTGGSTTEPNVLYFNLNPTSSSSGGVASGSVGQTTGKNDYNNTPNVPFLANARIYWTSGYAEVTINTGSGWGPALTTGLVYNTGSTNRELKIPWTVINNGSGIPSSFNWLAAASSTGSPGFIYDQFPIANYSGNSSGTPTYFFYQTVDATASGSATNPCSAARESYTNYNTGSYAYTSGLPSTLYDFTLGNTSASGTTDMQSSITIGRDVVVKNGTLNVTNGTAETISMANAAGNIYIFTSSGGHIYGTDNGVGNDLNLTVNSGAAITLGGDDATANTDDHKFFTVTVQSGGTLALSKGILVRYGAFNVSGTLKINAGGYVEGSATSAVKAAYSSGTLVYSSGGSYGATDFEWPVTSPPTNVTVQTTGTDVTLNDSKTIAGVLTLSSVLDINGQTLTINGTLSGSGTLTGSSTSNLTIGGAAGTLNFTSGSGVLKNLVLSPAATATLGTALNITSGSGAGTEGSVIAGSGATLTTGGNLTINSDANGTASIGNSAGTISGNVTVQRYIPNDGSRAWRILSVPTSGSQTIQNTWQANTEITTSNAANLANGFDAVTPFTSMQTYQSGAWADITSTKAPLSNVAAYSIYIRGDRSATPANTTVTATTLSAMGSIFNGSVTTNIPSGSFGIIGNQYASAIDFTQITKTNINTEVYYVWDPKLIIGNSLGSYQAINHTSSNNTWYAFPGGGSYPASSTTISPRLESGQAFFVATTASGASVTLTQASKVTGSQQVFRPESPVSGGGQFRTNFYDLSSGSADFEDANQVVFSDLYSDAIDNNDVIKFSPIAGQETLDMLRDGKLLMIEGRQPVAASDTIFFDMQASKQQQYKLEFVPSGFIVPALTAVLEDSYLGTKTPVDLSNTNSIVFTIDGNVASSASNRFRVVFTNNSSPVPVTFTRISASNSGNGATVSWAVAGENSISEYIVEHSTDGKNFSVAATVSAKSNSGGAVDYSLSGIVFTGTGANYYRVHSVSVNGQKAYTNIIELSAGADVPSIGIYPNPVKDGQINVKLVSQAAGAYVVRLVTATGQVLYALPISYAGGGSQVQRISLPLNIAKGLYKIEVINPAKEVHAEQIIIE